MGASFRIPLNLPHAATCAVRVMARLREELRDPESSVAFAAANQLTRYLRPYHLDGENPPGAEGIIATVEALALARQMVDSIKTERLGNDRLGQCVRNLFECLEEGEEGAELGLVAGENPRSIQRPV